MRCPAFPRSWVWASVSVMVAVWAMPLHAATASKDVDVVAEILKAFKS